MAVPAVGELFNDILRVTWGVGVSVDLDGRTSGETSTPPPALLRRRVDVRAEPGATNKSTTSTRWQLLQPFVRARGSFGLPAAFFLWPRF